jgi:hypothetical protein
VKLAHNAEIRKRITEEGGLEPVLFLSRTDDTEIHREVLPALCTLSFAEPNKIEICKHGGLTPLLAMVSLAT